MKNYSYNLITVLFNFSLFIVTILPNSVFANNEAQLFVNETSEIKLNNSFNNTYSFKLGGRTIYSYQKPTEFIDNPHTGYQHRPNSKIRHISRTLNKVIYDSTYHFDAHGHRLNLTAPRSYNNKFLFLYGCSFIYGNGINTKDSLNNLFNNVISDYYSYNWAIGASGPHMLLAKLQSLHETKPSLSPFNTGKLIYFYHHDHIRRSSGLQYSSKGLNKSPYFKFNQGKAVKVSTIGSHFKKSHIFYSWVNSIFNFFNLKLTFPRISSENIKYFCNILKATKKEFNFFWPSSQFEIYNHSFSQPPPEELTNCLEKENIKMINVDFNTNESDFIPIDGHPTKDYNTKMVNFTLRQIKTK